MPDDPRVQRLIEEMLDSGRSPEEVCRDTPELLPGVRDGWRRFRALEARIDELFPEPGSIEGRDSSPFDEGPIEVPGYDVVEVLGRGGVGVVYKAVHRKLHRTVALKMLLAGAFATRAERRRFAREAELVAGLRHPNVVQVYDVGDLDGRPYFTMEFVDGGSLAQQHRRHPAAGPRGRRARGDPGRRRCRGAPRRDRPPGPEAVERAAHGRRLPQGHGLRARPGPGGRVLADPDRRRRRDTELHGPRAGPGPDGPGRTGLGRLRGWGRSCTSC